MNKENAGAFLKILSATKCLRALVAQKAGTTKAQRMHRDAQREYNTNRDK
jgi:hypothetical protein